MLVCKSLKTPLFHKKDEKIYLLLLSYIYCLIHLERTMPSFSRHSIQNSSFNQL